MCRFLIMKSERPTSPLKLLEKFADSCKASKKWQGDGWGVYYYSKGEWDHYKSTRPVWEERESFKAVPECTFLAVHARGAFGEHTIKLENTQPFHENDWLYVFNGHIEGVKIKARGRIGADKVFNLLLTEEERLGDLGEAITSTSKLIEENSDFIEALNIGIVRDGEVFAYCKYNSKDPEYHALRYHESPNLKLVSSDALPGLSFKEMKNNELKVF